MAARPVEWVLVVFYGPEAHRDTYGRDVKSTKYTKDFIQLSRRKEFLEEVASLFGVDRTKTPSVPLTYRWATGSATGEFVFNSSDRAHLKWGTKLGTPPVWKMSRTPSELTDETIPGDPSHLKYADAEGERAKLAGRGAGQPYLMAIKLRGEPRTLHLRVYLSNPKNKYAWADIQLAPKAIQDLASRTKQSRALAWSAFASGGVLSDTKVDDALSQLAATSNPTSVLDSMNVETGRALARYLRHPGYGLFFDATRNHNAWIQPAPLPKKTAASIDELLKSLDTRFPPTLQGDAAAEAMEADPTEVESFRKKIEHKSFEVPDSTATGKTRGSAQKAFADVVKGNYGTRCAITGIATKTFLVAAHIVPWSKDQSIRLDPSNGICLSLLVDRAFESGYLLIEDDYTIRIDWGRVGKDQVLQSQLKPYDGKKLTLPTTEKPKVEYLRRRRALAVLTE